MTHSFFFNRYPLSKLAVTALLFLGIGLGSAEAKISSQVAGDAAAAIRMGKSSAFDTAQYVTRSSTAADADADANLIVSAFSKQSDQKRYAADIALGVASNYPNQFAAIVTKLMKENDFLGSSFLQRVSANLTADQAVLLAEKMDSLLKKQEKSKASQNKKRETEAIQKEANKYSIVLMAAAAHSASGSTSDRVAAMSQISAIFGRTITGKFTSKSDPLTKVQNKQLKNITNAFCENLKNLAGGDSNLVNEGVFNFLRNFKSGSSGSSKQFLSTISEMKTTILGYFPPSMSSVILSAISAGVNNGSLPASPGNGNVVTPESPT